MADHKILRIDIGKRSPAFAAELFSWHVHPLRSHLGLSVPSYTAVAFENAASSYVHEDLSRLVTYVLRSDDKYLIEQKTWYVIESELHVEVYEQYAQRILIFQTEAQESVIRKRRDLRDSDKIEWVDFSLDAQRDERAKYRESFNRTAESSDRFMTKLKQDIKTLLDGTISPKFLDLSDQFHRRFDEQKDRFDKLDSQYETIQKTLEELKRKP